MSQHNQPEPSGWSFHLSNPTTALWVFFQCRSATEISPEMRAACHGYREQRNAASEVNDYEGVARIAKKEIPACEKTEFPPYVKTRTYAFLAGAQIELGKPAEALQTANECIALFYKAPFCHELKSMALQGLGKPYAAVAAYRVAMSVSHHVLNETAGPDMTPLYRTWLSSARPEAQKVIDDFTASNSKK